MQPTLRQATAADAARVARLLIDTRAAFTNGEGSAERCPDVLHELEDHR
jgi:hypothetical protein